MIQNINLISITGKIGSGKDTVGKMIQYFTSELYLKDNFTYQQYLNRLGEFTGYKANHFSKWKIKKFADKLKLGLQYDFPSEFNKDLWKTSGREYREEIIPSLGITRRKALQLRGEKMREINKDYWVNALFSEYLLLPKTRKFEIDGRRVDKSCYYGNCITCKKQVVSSNKRFVKCNECIDKEGTRFPSWIITDTRFENELKAVEHRSGITIRINRSLENRFPELWKKFSTYILTDRINDSEFMKWLQTNYYETYKKLTHESETALDNTPVKIDIYNNGSIEDLFIQVEDICKKLKLI